MKAHATIPLPLPIIAVLVGGLLLSVLGWLSRPSEIGKRLENISFAISQVDHLQKGQGSPRSPQGALCNATSEGAAADMVLRLNRVAARTGLKTSHVNVAPDGLISSKLMAFSVRFDGSGDERAIRSLLTSLAPLRPQLFADTFDLKPSPDGVSFQMSGRFWCWARL